MGIFNKLMDFAPDLLPQSATLLASTNAPMHLLCTAKQCQAMLADGAKVVFIVLMLKIDIRCPCPLKEA